MGRTPRRGVEGAQPPQNKNKIVIGYHPGRGVEGAQPPQKKKKEKKEKLKRKMCMLVSW